MGGSFMNDTDRSRRRFLLLTTKVALLGNLFALPPVFAQSIPTPPGPPAPPGAPGVGGEADDPTKTKINREDYERWLREVHAAAEKMAKQSGAKYQPEVINKFDKSTKETLKDNGYKIPSPPTNLRVE